MQRKKSAPPSAAGSAGSTADWTDAAFRPDLARGLDSTEPIQARWLGSAEAPASAGSRSSNPRALPEAVQAKMERAFDTSFAGVRIHEGLEAAALGARAFTQGTDIYFAPNQYAPHSQQGQELLGHELAHVVQQSEGRVSATRQMRSVAVNDDSALEREADVMGARAARGELARGGEPLDARQSLAAGGPVQMARFREKTASPKALSRLKIANSVIKLVNQKLLPFGAGNQADDVRRSHGASLLITEAMQANTRAEYIHRDVMKDQAQPGTGVPSVSKMAAIASHYGAGVCDNYSQVTFNALRVHASGEKLTRCSRSGLHHAFVIIGDFDADAETDLVVADPWPSHPQACLWVDFFGYAPRDALNIKAEMVADGTDGAETYKPDITLLKPKAPHKQTLKRKNLNKRIEVHTDLWRHPHTVRADGTKGEDDYDDRPIFYTDPNWTDEEKKLNKSRFKTKLAEMEHLQPHALEQLGLL